MKGMFVNHEGKWRKILDVKDSGKPAHLPDGGNFYTLEGVAKPVHQSKIGKDIRMPDEINKYDRVETTADGKTELDYGKEALDKEPHKKDGSGRLIRRSELQARWNKLKKALDSDAAIMQIKDQEYDPDKDPNNAPENQSEAPPVQEESQDAEDQGNPDDESSDPSSDSDDSENEQLIEQALRDEGYEDAEIAHILHGHILPEATVDDHKAKNEQAEGQIDQQNMVEDSKLEREHKKKMQELEYRKAESEMADPEAEKGHRQRMMDLEHETQKKKASKEDIENDHRKKLQELELAAKQKEIEKQDPSEGLKAQQAALELKHKQRMMDLEYQKAKKETEKEDPTEEMKRKQLEFELTMKRMEKELELEFLKKELALKLKLTEEAAKQKHEHSQQQAEADASVNAQVREHQAKHKIAEAKKPPPKEDKSERPSK